MNAPTTGENRPNSAQAQLKARLNAIAEQEQRDLEQQIAELAEKVGRKNLAQKLLDARPEVYGQFSHHTRHEMIHAALSRAQGVAGLLSNIFLECDLNPSIDLVPAHLAHTVECLERDIREALTVLGDYRENGGFRQASEEEQA